MSDDIVELTVADERAWGRWLGEHHADSAGVWLTLAKRNTTRPTSLTYDQALDEALCHGWIDSQVRRGDETTYWQRFTPRGPRSRWSARNVAMTARLIDAGRMRPAGLAQIELAKADGRWEAAYAGPATAEVPEDLAAALAASPRAQAMFDILTSQNRYSVLHRVEAAKRADTRARRIAQFVDALAQGQTVHPQKRTLDG
ncbi:YdeI/OmpD-associated family protein [Rugosimonospora acidiphila]|uniref:YdeI/OmpD-associated family protein n=1 Tax=Rugosimonospora acidiphila TaxID=556531 RepID=A0ABP9RNW7_9ACTN